MLPSTAPAETEPSWHRNRRARRKRARRAVKAAKDGQSIDAHRLVEAKTILLRHHGTRGAAVATMAPHNLDVLWTLVGRNGKKMQVLGLESWQCKEYR